MKKLDKLFDYYILLFQILCLCFVVLFAFHQFSEHPHSFDGETPAIKIGTEFVLSLLPRIFLWAISRLYYLLRNEIVVSFSVLLFGIILGLAFRAVKNRLSDVVKLTVYIMMTALALIDLIIRFLPVRSNSVFPLYCDVVGIAVDVLFLLLFVLLLIREKVFLHLKPKGE